jgi:RNA polymerase sigma factor (sigma-70 family)
MGIAQLTAVLQHLRRVYRLEEDRRLDDGELLNRFFQHGEQAAFEVLVERYGSMVLGVCQRMLQNSHDAEDAFQATFLVVVHKGRSLLGRETIGNWLYGVAYHTALKARAAAMLRRRKESEAPTKACVEPVAEDGWEEIRPLLDQELNKLPDKFREVFVLCELLGKSRKEAAEQLGIPEGTLSSRLATARRKLSERLKHLGVTLPCGTLAVALAQNAASACVPAQLVTCTVAAASAVAAGATVAGGVVSPSVAALADGVVKSMFVAKCKTAVTALLVFSLLAAGAVSLSSLGAASDGMKAEVRAAVQAPGRDGDYKDDATKVGQRINLPEAAPPKPVPASLKNPAEVFLLGVVRNVDEKAGTITVGVGGDDEEAGGELLRLARGVEVQTLHGPGRIADLALSKNPRVQLRLTPDRAEVLGITLLPRKKAPPEKGKG